jgi:hypothetical protein
MRQAPSPLEAPKTFLEVIGHFYKLLYLLPILFTTGCVLRYGVNVPFLDQWGMPAMFQETLNGSLNFTHLWAQNNEHRIIFPKLVFLALGLPSRWNTLLEMLFGVLLIGTVFLIVYLTNERILKNVPERNRFIPRIALLLSGFVLFSLTQHQNWLWGFQVTFFLPQALVALSIFVISYGSVRSFYWRFLVAALLCFAASFSVAQGLLSWLAVLPLVLTSQASRNSRLLVTLLWLGLFISTVALYFYQYQSPSGETIPDKFSAFKHPIQAGHFLLVLLGAPFSSFNSPGTPPLFTLSTVIGACFLVGYLILVVASIRKNTFDIQKPLIALGLFGLLFAMMVTFGRSGWGIHGALIPSNSRYLTAPTFLLVSVIQMASFNFSDRKDKLRIYSSLLFATILSLAIVVNTNSSLAQAQKTKVSRESARVCLEMMHYISNVFDDTPHNCVWQLFSLKGYSSFIRGQVDLLEQIGFRKLAKDFSFVSTPATPWGVLEKAGVPNRRAQAEPIVQISGWAVLPDRKRIPEAIALSLNDQQTFLTAVYPNEPRPDVVKFLGDTRYLNSGWRVKIPANLLPAGEIKFHAWVYDPENQQFVRLAASEAAQAI